MMRSIGRALAKSGENYNAYDFTDALHKVGRVTVKEIENEFDGNCLEF